PGDGPTRHEDQPFHKELLEIAKDYKQWGRVDDPMRLGIEDCRMPRPAHVRYSESADEATHGQKLYSLFARDRKDYVASTKEKSLAGQAIVKEAWSSEIVKDMKPGEIDWSKVARTDGTQIYPYVTRGDKVYKATKPAGLFIMMKLDSNTPGTDDGWVY